MMTPVLDSAWSNQRLISFPAGYELGYQFSNLLPGRYRQRIAIHSPHKITGRHWVDIQLQVHRLDGEGTFDGNVFII